MRGSLYVQVEFAAQPAVKFVTDQEMVTALACASLRRSTLRAAPRTVAAGPRREIRARALKCIFVSVVYGHFDAEYSRRRSAGLKRMTAGKDDAEVLPYIYLCIRLCEISKVTRRRNDYQRKRS